MIVCEVGINHLGSKKRIQKYINYFYKSKCDAITFQILEKSFFESKKYNQFFIENDYFLSVYKKIKQKKKLIGASIDDRLMIPHLEKIGIDFYKVLSKDIKNIELSTDLINLTNKKIYISTSFASDRQIKKLFSLFNKNRKRIILIHTNLKKDIKYVNLDRIKHLKLSMNTKVAFGLHCSDINVLYASIPYGPESFFFYIKLDNKNIYPDNNHAVQASDLNKISSSLKNLPKALKKTK